MAAQMIDRYWLPIVQKAFNPIAHWAKRRGIRADQVTIAGFCIGLMACPLIITGHFGWALLMIAINRSFDGIDGLLARQWGATDRGAFLDITLDFLFYALIPMSFAFYDHENALASAFVLTSFMGTATSFLAFALLAEKRGLKSIQYPNKGIYYIGGLTEGFETMVYIAVICLWPRSFVVMSYIFGTACFFTASLRIVYGYQQLPKEPN